LPTSRRDQERHRGRRVVLVPWSARKNRVWMDAAPVIPCARGRASRVDHGPFLIGGAPARRFRRHDVVAANFDIASTSCLSVTSHSSLTGTVMTMSDKQRTLDLIRALSGLSEEHLKAIARRNRAAGLGVAVT
jgi:hypothetical protein